MHKERDKVIYCYPFICPWNYVMYLFLVHLGMCLLLIAPMALPLGLVAAW